MQIKLLAVLSGPPKNAKKPQSHIQSETTLRLAVCLTPCLSIYLSLGRRNAKGKGMARRGGGLTFLGKARASQGRPGQARQTESGCFCVSAYAPRHFLCAFSHVWAIELSARVRVQTHTHTGIHSQVATHLKAKAVRFVFVAVSKWEHF